MTVRSIGMTIAAAATFVAGWGDVRFGALPLGTARVVRVSNTRDDGPGSLRDALFVAGHATTPVKIQLPRGIIRLARPLPPVDASVRVEIVGYGPSETTIDASDSGGIGCLELVVPGSSIRGIRVRHASGIGLLIKAPRAVVSDSALESSRTGIYVSSTAVGLKLRGTRFAGNQEGLRFEAPAAGSTVVDSEFIENRVGIWTVGSTRSDSRSGLSVARNDFRKNVRSIVTANTAIEIRDSLFSESIEESILLLEGGGNVVRNTIADGKGHGLVADRARDVTIRQNRIEDHRNGAGILLKDCRSVSATSNTVLRNAYGIFVVAGDDRNPPEVRTNLVKEQTYDGISVVGGVANVVGNELTRNGAFGMHLVSIENAEGVIRPQVRNEANSMGGNRAGSYGYGTERRVSGGGT